MMRKFLLVFSAIVLALVFSTARMDRAYANQNEMALRMLYLAQATDEAEPKKDEKSQEQEPAADEGDADGENAGAAEADAESGDGNQSVAENDIPIPEVQRDLSKLPFPVRRMRELILEAAATGDVEKLRILVGAGSDVTEFSLGGIDGDPIEFLKESSGDQEGHEILAILTEVLEMGYVHIDVGTENELYVWPYFFGLPLDQLTPQQRVELFRIVTYGDYEDMESFGAYIYYRLGITPEGRWRFFVAGD